MTPAAHTNSQARAETHLLGDAEDGKVKNPLSTSNLGAVSDPAASGRIKARAAAALVTRSSARGTDESIAPLKPRAARHRREFQQRTVKTSTIINEDAAAMSQSLATLRALMSGETDRGTGVLNALSEGGGSKDAPLQRRHVPVTQSLTGPASLDNVGPLSYAEPAPLTPLSRPTVSASPRTAGGGDGSGTDEVALDVTSPLTQLTARSRVHAPVRGNSGQPGASVVSPLGSGRRHVAPSSRGGSKARVGDHEHIDSDEEGVIASSAGLLRPVPRESLASDALARRVVARSASARNKRTSRSSGDPARPAGDEDAKQSVKSPLMVSRGRRGAATTDPPVSAPASRVPSLAASRRGAAADRPMPSLS